MMEKGSTYRQTSGLDHHDVEDGCFITDFTRETVHFLNPTAAAVLALCDGTRDAPAIAQVLQDAFGLASPPCGDVEACLTSLAQQGLIEA